MKTILLFIASVASVQNASAKDSTPCLNLRENQIFDQRYIQQHQAIQRLFTSEAPRFRFCQDKAVQKLSLKDGAHSGSDLGLKIKVDAAGKFTVTSKSASEIIETAESIEQARLQLILSDCYASAISKMKVAAAKETIPTLCWDGDFPIVPSQKNTNRSSGSGSAK